MKNWIFKTFKTPHKLIPAFLLSIVVLHFSTNGFAQHAFFHLLGIDRLQPYTWTGYGVDANWTTGQNWSDNSPPGASDTARFVTTACSSNCSPTIDTSVNIGGINIDATYPGTVTQAAGQTITVGSAGWVQAGGTFVGSDSAITINSTFSLTGGTFTSTSAEMLVTSGFATVGGTFNHGSGTLRFDNGAIVAANSTVNISVPAGLQLWNLRYSGGYAAANGTYKVNIAAGGFDVLNDFQIGLTAAGATGTIFASGGSIQVKGNVVVDPSVKIEANTNPTNLILNGAGAQTYSSTLGRLPSLTINKVSGAVTPLGGTTNLIVDGFTNTAGSFTAPPGVFTVLGDFNIAGGTYSENSGSMVFDRYAGGGTSFTISLANALNVASLSFGGGQPAAATAITWTLAGATPRFNSTGNLNISNTQGGTGNILVNGGEIFLAGNYVAGAYSGAGTAALTFNGTGAQTFSKTGAGSNLAGDVTVDKSAGTLTLSTVAALANGGQDFTITTGTVNMAGFGLNVGSVLTIGVNGRLICAGGTATYGSFVVNGEVSCGSSLGITWTGLAGNNQWSTNTNWTNNTIPADSDVAIFNSMCSGANCNATMQPVVSVRGLRLNSDYTGTLTAATTLTVGPAGFSQAGGTYDGVASTKTVSGPFALSGGTYTATSGLTTFNSSVISYSVTGAPTFGHSSGSFVFTAGHAQAVNLSVGLEEYNNVRFNGAANVINISGTLSVNGLLHLDEPNGGGGDFASGVMLAKGDVSLTNYGKRGGVGLVRIGGGGAQTVTASGPFTSNIPSFAIEKPSGTVSFVGTIYCSRHLTHVSGSADFTASTLIFNPGNGFPITITPGPVDYNNITIRSSGTPVTLVGDMNVNGTLTFSDLHGTTPATISGGNFNARGDVTSLLIGNVGSAIVKMVGSTDQTISGISSARIPNIQISSTGGTVFLVGTLHLRGSFIYESGVVDAGTSTLVFQGANGSNSTWTPGPISYYHVTSNGHQANLNLTGDATVLGTFTAYDPAQGNPGFLTGGSILAYGDVLMTGGGRRGDTVIRVVGSTDQTILGTAITIIPNLEIASTGGTVYLAGIIRPFGSFSHLSGNISGGSSELQFNTTGTISIIGTPTFNDVSFTGSNYIRTLTGTLRSAGVLLLSFGSASNRHVNGGVLQALGDVNAKANGANGTAQLLIEGATSTIFSAMPSVVVLPTGTVTVNKSGGASVALATNVWFATAGQDLNVTAGTLNLAGSDLGINDVLTIDAAGTVLCNGGNLSYGSLVNAGTVTCGASPFLWSGAGGNSNWDNPGNWFGGVVPGPNDLAELSGDSGSNSDVTLNVNVDVKGLRMDAEYEGTITQTSGITITVGDKGWFQNAGIFLGGNAAINLNGTMTLNGGTFQATSGTTTSEFNFLVNNTPTFDANNGTFVFTGTNGGSTISAGSTEFHNLTLAGTNGIFKLNSSTVTVNGTLTMGDSVSGVGGVSNGTIVAKHNVVINQEGYAGNANLTFDGPLNSTLSVAALASTFSGTIAVNKKGILTLTSAVSFSNISGQDFDLNTGTLNLGGNTLTTADLTLAQYSNLICLGGTYPSTTLTDSGAVINCAGYAFNWIGGGINSNWNTAANWSGGVVPNNTQVAYFSDANCGVNCDVTITANPNVHGVVMMPDYTGTITQNAGVPMSVGNAGWTQASGTFLGGNSAMTVSRYFFVSGGTFQATSNTLRVAIATYGSFSYAISDTATVTPNGGTIHLETSCGMQNTATPGSFTYNNLIISGGCSALNFGNKTVNVGGDLTIPYSNYSSTINNVTLRVSGNFNIGESATSSWAGSYIVEMIGNPLGQSVTSLNATARIQHLVINTGSNPLSLVGVLRIGRNLDVVSANPANVTTTGSTIYFAPENSFAASVNPGTIAYNNVQFRLGTSSSVNLNGATMTVDGNMVIDGATGTMNINNGTYNIRGNLTTTTAGGAATPTGTALMRLVGNAGGQLITGVATIRIPNLEFATGANPVTMSGSVRVNSATTVTSGSPNMSGAAFTTTSLALGGNTLTKSGGVLTVNSVVAGTGALFGGTVAP